MVTCHITKSASIPVAPGLVFGHDLSWYESGRDVHAYCTDSPVTNMRFAVWVPVLVAALWLIVFCRGDEPVDRATSSAGAAVVSAQSPYRGSGSCSATACHGNITPLPPKISTVWRSEHTTWISDDCAFACVSGLVRQAFGTNRANLAGAGGNVKRASEDIRCLACHTTPCRLSSMTATAWMNADGVGCESCHGPSARWIGPHTTEGWTEWSPQAKADLGFKETKSLVHRAKICADCHVGRRSRDGLVDRDVNHDLIAAGHPRLNFEFSAYLANMPPHWSEKEPNPTPAARNPALVAADFPARAWVIGRLVTAKAAMELLEARAAAAESRMAPWPEFTEYGCFSCHHDLRDQACAAGLVRPAPMPARCAGLPGRSPKSTTWSSNSCPRRSPRAAWSRSPSYRPRWPSPSLTFRPSSGSRRRRLIRSVVAWTRSRPSASTLVKSSG